MVFFGRVNISEQKELYRVSRVKHYPYILNIKRVKKFLVKSKNRAYLPKRLPGIPEDAIPLAELSVIVNYSRLPDFLSFLSSARQKNFGKRPYFALKVTTKPFYNPTAPDDIPVEIVEKIGSYVEYHKDRWLREGWRYAELKEGFLFLTQKELSLIVYFVNEIIKYLKEYSAPHEDCTFEYWQWVNEETKPGFNVIVIPTSWRVSNGRLCRE